jgi:hypothetical protein
MLRQSPVYEAAGRQAPLVTKSQRPMTIPT